ncbi:hypothetical protein IMSAGC020_01613 [Lachnospiraceae bacterium]|nr:hypothetical protein IMSAGC020_01613 [Lachnospiraceae bacterium]
MKKWVRYIVLSLVAIILCFLYAHVDKADYIYDNKIDSSEYKVVNINEDSYFSQVFECTNKELDGIAIKILVSNMSDNGKLVYSLQNSDEKIVTQGKVSVSDIENGRINKIKFSKTLKGEAGELYTIYFKTEDLDEGESIGLYYEDQSKQDDGLKINDEKKSGTLILRTITHCFDLETFIVTMGFICYFVIFFKILYRLFA